MSDSLVLLNPHAGGGRAARLQTPLAQWLAQNAPTTVLAVPTSVEDAQRSLRDLPRGSRVVVVGGDGTLNQMLGALLERELSLGLVPCGSGNDTARAMSLFQTPWRQALAHALHAPARGVDVGVAQFDAPLASGGAQTQSVPFLSSLTVGFDASVGLRALNGPRWLRGLPRYLLATLRELLYLRSWDLQVQVDAALLHQGVALFASTLNTPSFGSGMPAVPHARIDDGQLNLLLAGAFGRAATLAMLPRLLAGWHLSHPRVQTRAFSHLRIVSSTPVPLAADGEYLGEAQEVNVQVRAGVLPAVLGPAS